MTFVFALRRAAAYVLAQVVGGLLGSALAHHMFELPVLEVATKLRNGRGPWLAER